MTQLAVASGHAPLSKKGYGPFSAAAVLAALFLALHFPYFPASLEDLDSVNFALGLREFDVARHQPHPPGYPVYIAIGKAVNSVISSEARSLTAVAVISGALAVLALFALFSAIGSDWSACAATVLAATAPLYWFTASRPLSDTPGLALVLAVQALILRARSRRTLVLASFLAAVAIGIRSQAAWLTMPLLIFVLLRRSREMLLPALAAFAAGALVWGVPLLLLSGGIGRYWSVLFSQGAEDLTGVAMLWTTPTPRQLIRVLFAAFIAPWAHPVVASIVLVLALIGVVRLYRQDRRAVVALAVAFGPYLVFDLLFQEAQTTRYALPLVVPIAYLAACGARMFGVTATIVLVGAIAMFDAHIGGTSLAAYAREPAPAFRLLADTRRTQSAVSAPAVAMHRRADFDFRRPIVWMPGALPAARRLPAPAKHEWLQLVNYWNTGGRDEVWFIADPLRSDLALVDHARAAGSYRWSLPYPVLIGGVRPNEMNWYRLAPPGWYLGEGWALTPEAAGVAKEDRKDLLRGPIQGWIRRRRERATMVVGGRNFATDGSTHQLAVAIDGRTVDTIEAPPGFFLRLLHLEPGVLLGSGEYAAVSVRSLNLPVGAHREDADRRADPAVAIEQFDVQSDDRVVFGYGEGWHEQEYNPATGALWRWTSERSSLRVHAAGHPLLLTLWGEPPSVNFSRPSHVKVTAGGRAVAEQTLSTDFILQVRLPADLVGGDESTITIETDQVFAPADRSWRRSPDKRHLGLRVFGCEISPAS